MKLEMLLILSAIFSPGFVSAGTAGFDTLVVSSISGQSFSNGITFSSSVYLGGGSLTLQGGGGYISAQSSITASSFFGNGSALTGIPALIATQTFTGANTFVSSFTVQSGGRQIVLSTSASANNIAISGSGAITFYPELHNSSSTAVPQASNSNTTFGPCVAGSTLTIITTGGRVEVNFAGVLTGEPVQLSFLQDGNFVGDLSRTKGLVYGSTVFGGYIASGSFSYLLNAPAAGTHSYCLTLAGGTLVSGYDSFSGYFARNLFYVEEIK